MTQAMQQTTMMFSAIFDGARTTRVCSWEIGTKSL